jgi:hypothetical protein
MTAICPDTLPAESKALDQWCVYKLEVVKGKKKKTKVPYQTTGKRASSTKPNTWASFKAALAAYQDFDGYNGICFMLSEESGIVFIDLDDCIKNGIIEPWALEIVKRFNSYTERSQSGEGLHILIKGTKPGVKCRRKKSKYPDVEIYSRFRQCCLTGDVIDGHGSIEARQDELNELYREIFGEETRQAKAVKPTYTEISDASLINKMVQSKNGNAIKALWDGSTLGYNGDESAADQALMNHLAFWTGGNEAQMERMFSSSSRGSRDKWRNRADYRDRTTKKAISDAREFYEPPKTRAEPNTEGDPEISEDITTKALEVLERGNPIQYIADSCGGMVLGAEKAFKKLCCCMAVQGVKQSAGLHPKLNGESGSGKTWVVLTFAHHLPPIAVVKGSSSNLAAFYHKDGDQVFRILDDYIAGNETLDTIIKQTSSVFHQKYDHRTVKKQEPITLQIGSEQTWAITSVDGSQDIQVLNRQIPINVDDSEDLTRKVNARTIKRYGKGEEQFPEDEAVQICREMWRILRADGIINVRIPYFDRIDWLDISNRRNPSIFMDLLIAHTAMNRRQREQDADGYYLAIEDDFQAAKALFTDKDAEELVRRLTRKEREFADLLIKHPSGLTREEAAEALNISGNRVSQLANGEKGKGGLTQKLPGFSIADITDSLKLNEEKSRHIRKVVYKLTAYDPLTGFEAIVRLLPETDNNGTSKPGKHLVSDQVSNDQSKKIDNREREIRERDIESKDSKGKVREASCGGGNLGISENPSFSLSNPEKSLLDEETATGAAKSILTGSSANPYRPYCKAPDSEEKSLLDHIVCAKCGASLDGKGQIEKNGKTLCLRPGCGYPARGEAKT